MNKEAILKITQSEKRDEMELHIKDKSMMCPYLVMVIVAALFNFIKALHGVPITDLTATVCASVGTTSAYRYAKLKDNKIYLLQLLCLLLH